MQTQLLFGISIVFGFTMWAIVAWRYLWPQLSRLSRIDALKALLVFHGFRFVGLAFLVHGVVSPNLPSAFARPVAFGDFIAACLALVALLALPSRAGIVLAWVFSVWGSADLLNAYYEGSRIGLDAGQLGALFFIPTFAAPLLLVTHVLFFRLLLQRNSAAVALGRAGAA